MHKLKRFICFLLVLVMFTMMVPLDTVAATVENLSTTGAISFVGMPGVYEMGDGYAVIWVTSTASNGYIKYSYGGQAYTVYDMRNGIVRTNDTVHVVKVPHEHLDGNSYTVYSQEVTKHSYATTTYGATVSKGPIKLKAYDNNPNDFNILALTDVHGKLDWAKNAPSRFSDKTDPDLFVFSGDLVDNIDTKANIEKMFNIMGTTTNGKYPIVYCRGNHELRGGFSTMLLEYFPTKTGEFYFDFRYGPLWGVVLDTGEGSDDPHQYFGNLANFKNYTQKQEVWLRQLRRDTTATFRFGIYHIPHLDSYAQFPNSNSQNFIQNGVDYIDSIGHLGLQCAVSGHAHNCRIIEGQRGVNPGVYETYAQHDSVMAGGSDSDVATLITLNNSKQTAYITARKSNNVTHSHTDGNTKITYNFNNYPLTFSDYIGPTPEPLAEPINGTNNQFKPTTSSKGTVTISTPPAVFETGGDWYNVVWTTATTDSNSKGCTGYVEYEYNGVTYQAFDEVSGYRRSYSSVHTARVPKEHLNNNKYKVGGFLVQYAYTDPVNKVGKYYVSGDHYVSGEYVFEDRSGDKAVNMVVCSDIRIDESGVDNTAKAKATVESLGTSPAVVIMNGDSVTKSLEVEADIAKIVKAASTISGGIHPVVLSRGESECRGYRSPDLMRYFPTVTGEHYYSVDMGDYTLVNIDTAEDQVDDAPSRYGGRVKFADLKAKQLEWINSLPEGKLAVISHIPLDSAPYCEAYQSVLKNKGAVVSLSGHTFNYSTSGSVSENSIYTITSGGYYYNNPNNFNSVSVLLSGDYAYINSKNYADTAKDEAKTVDLTTGSTVSYDSEEPPKIDGIYVVSKPEHLVWMSKNCTSTNSFTGETFIMANDIDMKLYPFTPIGGNDTVQEDENYTSKAFSGTFDGNRYKIKNLNITTDKNNVGLFGVVRKGTVKNLTLDSGMVDGGWYVGGFAGYSSVGTFENCYNHLTIYSASGSKVAGFIGFYLGGSLVESCGNYGSVCTHHSGGNAAGIAGQIIGSTENKIFNTFNRGNIIAHGATGLAGGIFGYSGSANITLKNCYNASSVTCPGSQGMILASYGSSGKLSVSNTYFASGFNGATKATKNSNSWSSASGSGTISSMTQSAMKSRATANKLNADVFTYDASVNDGYPIHVNVFLEPERVPGQEPVEIILIENSIFTLENGKLMGVTPDTTIDDIVSNIANESGIDVSGVVTGGTITLTVDGEVVDTAVIVILGDVDGSGSVNTTDYVRMNCANNSLTTLEGDFFTAADIDKSGSLTTSDLSRVKNHFVRSSSLYS